jgi:hypothetical protein
VIVRRDGDVLLDDYKAWRGLDLMQTVGRVADTIKAFKPRMTFVDGAGVGAGVVDRLRQLGFKVYDVQSGSSPQNEGLYGNLRAEMWGKMREWLRLRASIPAKSDLADDLCAPLYNYDVRNRLLLEKKQDMKKRGLASPDIADALALTFAAPVNVDIPAKITPAWQDSREYSPFAELD